MFYMSLRVEGRLSERETVFNTKQDSSVVVTYSDVHDLGDFPQVNKEADEDADLHHKVGLVVQNVQQNHQRLKNSKYDGAHRQTF